MKTLIAFILLCASALAVDYPVIAVRVKRAEGRQTNLPRESLRFEPGAEFGLVNPDGTWKETLFKPTDGSGVLGVSPSLDAKKIYYTLVRRAAKNLILGVSEIWVYDIATKQHTKLLAEPDTQFAYPQEYPGGKLIYCTNKHYLRHTPAQMQLWVCDLDGKHQKRVGQLNLGSAIEPVLDPNPTTKQCNLLISTLENQAQRDRRQWGLWSIRPDYSHWEPIFSGFLRAHLYHFHCAAKDEDGKWWRASIQYYNGRSFGSLRIAPRFDAPRFEHTKDANSPQQKESWIFSPVGAIETTQWTTMGDRAAPLIGDTGLRIGKVTQPAPTPDGRLLLVWTPGPANRLNRPSPEPFVQTGIYSVPLGTKLEPPTVVNGKVTPPASWKTVYAEDGWCAWGAKALVPFKDIYGFDPVPYDWDKHETSSLPVGTPFGVIGGGWISKGETRPIKWEGQQFLEAPERDKDTSPFQGFSVPHKESDVEWMEFFQMETPHVAGSNTNRFTEISADVFGERYKSLGRIKAKDANGNPVKRWAVEVPADVPIGMATIDKNGRILGWSATWKKAGAGKSFTQACNGCHLHTDKGNAAAGFVLDEPLPTPVRLDGSKGVKVPEWYRDIKPIWTAKCAGCHEPANNAPSIPLAATVEKWSILARPNFDRALSSWVTPHKAKISPLYARLVTTDATQKMPKTGTLTAAEIDLFGRWIDTGMVRAKDATTPLTDTTLPTLSIRMEGMTLRVGAWDSSGIASVTANLDGVSVTLAGPIDSVWSASLSKLGTVEVTVTDKNGLKEMRTKVLKSSVPVPPYDPLPDLKNLRKATKQNLDLLDEIIRKIETSK